MTNSLNLSSFNRPTVVTPNPVASHPIQRTSTPFLSIPIPPEAPRNCVAIGQFVIPTNQLHSPNCSEVSSIGGSVFEEEDLEENIAFEMVNPDGTVDNQQLIDSIQLGMQQAEVTCKNKLSKFNRNLKVYTNADLDEGTLEFHGNKMEDIKLMFDDLTDHIDDFINKYSKSMSKENLTLWQNNLSTVEASYTKYLRSFMPVLKQLKTSISSMRTVPLNRSSFESQQLDLLREQNEIQKTLQKNSKDETVRISSAKRTVVVNKLRLKWIIYPRIFLN